MELRLYFSDQFPYRQLYLFCAFELAVASCTPLVPFVAKIPSHRFPLPASQGENHEPRSHRYFT